MRHLEPRIETVAGFEQRRGAGSVFIAIGHAAIEGHEYVGAAVGRDVAYVTFGMAIETCEPHTERIGDGAGDVAFCTNFVGFEFITGDDADFEIAFGIVRAGRDDARGAVLSEEQRLRPLQHFDLGHVELAKTTHRGPRNGHAIDIERDGLIGKRIGIDAGQAAYRNNAALRRGRGFAGNEGRNRLRQRIDRIDPTRLQLVAADGLDLHGRVDAGFLASAGRDDDGV
nr:hypothetical protein [Croceicoccus sp. YJ47]